MDKLSDKIVLAKYKRFQDEMIPVRYIKEFIKVINGRIISKQGASDYILNGNELVKFIEEKSGDALLVEDNHE